MNLVFLENVSMCEIFGIKFSVSHTVFCYHDDLETSQQGQGVKVGRWSRSSDQGGKTEKMSNLYIFFWWYNHYKKIHKTI